MNCYQKLMTYLSIKKIENSHRLELSITDFPCLKKYADYLRTHGVIFRFQNEKEIQESMPFCNIVAIDSFWKEIFGDAGFIYDVASEMFVFHTYQLIGNPYFHNPLPLAVDKAISFVKELKKRGYL